MTNTLTTFALCVACIRLCAAVAEQLPGEDARPARQQVHQPRGAQGLCGALRGSNSAAQRQPAAHAQQQDLLRVTRVGLKMVHQLVKLLQLAVLCLVGRSCMFMQHPAAEYAYAVVLRYNCWLYCVADHGTLIWYSTVAVAVAVTIENLQQAYI